VKAGTARSRQSVTDSLFRLGGHSGAPERFPALGAARLGPGNASAHPLDNHAALELGKHAHHLKHRLAGGRRGVDALLMQEQLDAEAVQLGEEAAEVLQRTAETIDRPSHDNIEPAARGILVHGVESCTWPQTRTGTRQERAAKKRSEIASRAARKWWEQVGLLGV
jgi:hypothetical protein